MHACVLLWNVGVPVHVPLSTTVGGVTVLIILAAVFVKFRKNEAVASGRRSGKQILLSVDGMYSDKLVEITDDEIMFRAYYFPAGSKRVKLSAVEHIEQKRPSPWNGKWRLHGTGSFGTWFPADYKRPIRDAIFVMKVHGQGLRIGFTVEDSQTVSEIFRQKGLLKKTSEG